MGKKININDVLEKNVKEYEKGQGCPLIFDELCMFDTNEYSCIAYGNIKKCPAKIAREEAFKAGFKAGLDFYTKK